MIPTYSLQIYGRKKEALNQLWSLMFFKQSKSKHSPSPQNKTQNAIPSEDKELHFIMHGMLLAFHQCIKLVTVFKISNGMISLGNTAFYQMSGGW